MLALPLHAPTRAATTLLGCALVLGGCELVDEVHGVVIIDQASQALTAADLLSVNGTYGAGCTDRAGSWSVEIASGATLAHQELSVVLNDTACALTLTSLVADQTYPATPSLTMTAAYQGSASAFSAGSVAFSANARLDSTTYASDFTLTILSSDDPGAGSGELNAKSCVAFTCGPTQNLNCCESPLVTGGTYARSYDVSGDGMYPDSSKTATVSDFRLDKYEVTVARFRQFVALGQGTQAIPPVAGAGAHANIAGSGWSASWNASLTATNAALKTAVKCNATYQTWTDAPGSNESRPMNCITWYEAMAFCAWDGGFLPTEAEWNYAAAGGSEQRTYPWSSPPGSLVINPTHASYYVDATQQCYGDGVNGCALTDLIVVGTKPAGNGRWGQSDLGGNLYELTLDWYASPYPQNPCNDCANLTAATARVVRGGGASSSPAGLRTAIRSNQTPSSRNYIVGLRCARTP